MLIILFHSFMAFLASIGFCLIYNAPRKELIYCGLTGGVSWFVYDLVHNDIGNVMATLVATIIITIIARFLSYHRQAPSTLYHIPGIMPLVPGTMVYQTMIAALEDRILDAYTRLFEMFQIAGAIGIGSILILILPYSCFEIFRSNKK